MSQSKQDYQVASLAAGFTIGFGFLTVWEAMKQTHRNKDPLRSPYIWMIWGEILANVVLAILAFIYLEDIIGSTVPTFFFILLCWVFEIQLLMQIIINRIAVISESEKTARKIRWGTVAIISIINLAVFCIFIPAHLSTPPKGFVAINSYWDKISKVLICIVDAALNWYFLRTVRQRLVKYYGLQKYAPLVSFNAKLMVVSILMDLMLIGLMFLPNQIVFIQFHPVTYIVKLNIEMTMANMIRHLAKKNHTDFNDANSYSGARREYGPNTANHDPHHEVEMKNCYSHATAAGQMSDADSNDTGLGGIKKKLDYEVTVHNVPKSSRLVASSSGAECGFVRLDDEMSLTNNPGHPDCH